VNNAEQVPTPTQFAELMFGWKPFGYQIKPLNDLSVRVIMACGRQVGKTEMAAIKGLYFAVMNPNTVTLIISPTQRQSGILFRRMKRFVNINSQLPEERRIPIATFIRRETQTVIEFENGSEIHSLPAAEDGSNIRGFTAHFIIIDEGAYIDDRVFSTISPMLATTNGKLLLLGSPNGVNNFFYKAFSDDKLRFIHYHVTSYENPLIDKNYLENEKDSLSDVEFRQEYMGEFLETVGVMFPLKTVENCMKRDWSRRTEPLPIYSYYLGFDPARFGEDDAVGIILEKRPDYGVLKGTVTPFSVADFIEMRGKSLSVQVDTIQNLHRVWKFNTIVIDSTAIGTGVSEPLVNEGLPVEPLSFTIKIKQDLYFNLLRLMESNQIILPNNMKLKKQFVELRQERQEGTGLTKIYHPRQGHDDFVTATALAVWGASARKPQPILFGRPENSFF